jgi:MFS family permease
MTQVFSTSRTLAGLFAADVISTAGTEMTAVALPWFVLVSTGSPTRMAAVLAAEFLGMSILGLWGGQIATRLGARRMMLACDLDRAVLVALVPVLYWTGILSFPVLVALGLGVGACFPAYSSSQRLVLAGIVGGDELRLTRAGGLLGAVNEAASFLGPALGGVLVVLIGPANVLVADAASYLCAFALVATLVPAAASGIEEGGTATKVRDGIRYVLRDRVLRRRVLGIGLIEIAFTAMLTTFPVLALHRGGATVAGWLLAAYGAGSVVGGLISSRARSAGGRISGWSAAGIAASAWLLLLPVPPWALTGIVLLDGIFSGILFPRFFAAVTTAPPPALRAQVMITVTVAISLPAPIGFLGAGLLAQHTGSTIPSLLLMAGSATMGALSYWPRSTARPPQSVVDQTPRHDTAGPA